MRISAFLPRIAAFIPVIGRQKRAIGLLVLTISMIATGVLRGRIADDENRVPKLDKNAAQFDPATLKTDEAGGSARFVAKGGLVIFPGSPSENDKVATKSTHPSMSFGTRDDELTDESGTSDVKDDKDGVNEDVAKLFSSEAGDGLGGFASPIMKGSHSSYGAGAAGGPGAYSSGMGSNFGHSQKPDERGAEGRTIAAENVQTTPPQAAAHVVLAAPYDPNRPFGNNDLTQKEDPKKLKEKADTAALAPVAVPEPGTLLLVTNGIVAAVGSRYLRRRRRH